GTFAIRLRDELMERKGGTLVNAEGGKGMREVWGKPSPWNDYYGPLEGETVGVAILDHPGNYRHPTHWHSRDYGLFAANPFGEHDYYRDKTRDAGLSLDTGKSARWRYRVVIHSGTTEEAGIAKMFADYAKTK
ncbi:MAG TPA: PmoA family protein, partial [Bryobacteraceae bacterium]|nr:PmoA family protein [Bryobacteraceae bacterium]